MNCDQQENVAPSEPDPSVITQYNENCNPIKVVT